MPTAVVFCRSPSTRFRTGWDARRVPRRAVDRRKRRRRRGGGGGGKSGEGGGCEGGGGKGYEELRRAAARSAACCRHVKSADSCSQMLLCGGSSVNHQSPGLVSYQAGRPPEDADAEVGAEVGVAQADVARAPLALLPAVVGVEHRFARRGGRGAPRRVEAALLDGDGQQRRMEARGRRRGLRRRRRRVRRARVQPLGVALAGFNRPSALDSQIHMAPLLLRLTKVSPWPHAFSVAARVTIGWRNVSSM